MRVCSIRSILASHYFAHESRHVSLDIGDLMMIQAPEAFASHGRRAREGIGQAVSSVLHLSQMSRPEAQADRRCYSKRRWMAPLKGDRLGRGRWLDLYGGASILPGLGLEVGQQVHANDPSTNPSHYLNIK